MSERQACQARTCLCFDEDQLILILHGRYVFDAAFEGIVVFIVVVVGVSMFVAVSFEIGGLLVIG